MVYREENPLDEETAIQQVRERIEVQAKRGRYVKMAAYHKRMAAGDDSSGEDVDGNTRVERGLRAGQQAGTAGSTSQIAEKTSLEPKVQVEFKTASEYIQMMQAKGREVEDMDYWSSRLESGR